jgi:hypothetical protein
MREDELDLRDSYQECLMNSLRKFTDEEIDRFARDEKVLKMAEKYASGELHGSFFLYIYSENNVEYRPTVKQD